FEPSTTSPLRWFAQPLPGKRIRTAQSAQIQHHSVFPQERVCRWIGGGIDGRSSDHLPLVIDVETTAPSVPRSMISPSFQRTAWKIGPPVSGSISLVVEPPAIHPRALITLAELSLPPGSVPRSVRSKRTLVTVLLSVHEQVMWTLSKTVTSVRLPFNNPTTEELLGAAAYEWRY